MWQYLKNRFGEHSTAWGGLIAFLALVASFYLPDENADVELAIQGVAIPIFVGLFLWKDD